MVAAMGFDALSVPDMLTREQVWSAFQSVVELAGSKLTDDHSRSRERGSWPNMGTVASALGYHRIPLEAFVAEVRFAQGKYESRHETMRLLQRAGLLRTVDGMRWPAGGRPADEGQLEPESYELAAAE